MERVKANALVMKMTDAEWQWDRKKLTFYFTAEKRVDFRTLVRELASMFRTRIELKQIGVRDEAKRLDGIGRCGRQYCSASWLPELRPVNLGVAKDQRLSLNPSQISGACGRLMCCLRYEHEFYVQSRRKLSRRRARSSATSRGEEKVIANDIFRERVTLRGRRRRDAHRAARRAARGDGGAPATRSLARSSARPIARAPMRRDAASRRRDDDAVTRSAVVRRRDVATAPLARATRRSRRRRRGARRRDADARDADAAPTRPSPDGERRRRRTRRRGATRERRVDDRRGRRAADASRGAGDAATRRARARRGRAAGGATGRAAARGDERRRQRHAAPTTPTERK